MDNIILITHGSGGDVIPFIRMGYTFYEMGYEVTIFTHCIYKERAIKNHLNFQAIDTLEEYKDMSKSLIELADPIRDRENYLDFHLKYYGNERTYREICLIEKSKITNDTLIIYQHRFSETGLLIAEKYGIPSVAVYLAPNYLAHMDIHEHIIGQEMRREINIVREKMKLPQIPSWKDWVASAQYKVGLWPNWYIKKEEIRKIPELRSLGFATKENDNSMLNIDIIKEFCNTEKKVVLITAGTSRLIREDFYKIAISGCIKAGMIAIVVSEFDDFIPDVSANTVLRLRHGSIQQLLQYVDIVIHHGGMGTVGEALEAGVPQLIMAHMVDRPDNANRLKELGVATVFPEKKWSSELIACGLNKIATDGSMYNNCLQLKERIRKENLKVNINSLITHIDNIQANKPGNVVMTTHWTDGDVRPFIFMGRYLKAQGYHVTIITHSYYKKQIEDQGIHFVAWDTDKEYQEMMKDMGNYTDTVAGKNEIKRFREKYESMDVKLREYNIVASCCIKENTVLIAKNRSEIASLLVSEKYGIPIIWVYMNPYEFGSMKNFEMLNGDELTTEVNQIRKKVGLKPIVGWLEWMYSPCMQVGLWPQWFNTEKVRIQNDFQKIGFPLTIERHMISDDLQKILDTNPIIITGGTSLQIREGFYEEAINGCKSLGKNIIVVSIYAELLPSDFPDNAFIFEYIPLQQAMEYASLVIHHGGIGTISNAIAAGVPQIILGDNVDRPLNGTIVEGLGLGKYLPPINWNRKDIQEAANNALNGMYHQTCSQYAEVMKNEFCLYEMKLLVDVAIGNPQNYCISYESIMEKQNEEESREEIKEDVTTMPAKVRQYLMMKAIQKRKTEKENTQWKGKAPL